MKKLYVIRHGKSDWNQGVRDFDRPLNSRGMKDAPKMGEYLLNNCDIPDHVLSSSANRAISTARLLLSSQQYDLAQIELREELYHASVQSILKEIATVSSNISSLYLFGHNPGLSDLVSYLSGIPTELKTCCVATLELQVENWDELSADTCILRAYISPRDI